MNIQVSPVDPEKILPFRDLYKQELNCQIVYDSSHPRKNCVQSHLLEVDGEITGYGSTWVGDYGPPKGTLFEFYVLPSYRAAIFTLFDEYLRITKPVRIQTQTNDPFLGVLIYDRTQKIIAGSILFSDWKTTNHSMQGAIFRRSIPEDKDFIFEDKMEPVADWLLEKNGKIIATGAVLYHYNRPYGDIHMKVGAAFRRKGFGRLLVQELKKVCYQSGSVPAAPCDATNLASRLTLEGAGFAPCGRLIYGDTVAGTS